MKLYAIFEYNEEVMHGGDDDPEAKEWFYEYVLNGFKHLVVDRSREIGDVIGTVTILLDPEEREHLRQLVKATLVDNGLEER